MINKNKLMYMHEIFILLPVIVSKHCPIAYPSKPQTLIIFLIGSLNAHLKEILIKEKISELINKLKKSIHFFSRIIIQ